MRRTKQRKGTSGRNRGVLKKNELWSREGGDIEYFECSRFKNEMLEYCFFFFVLFSCRWSAIKQNQTFSTKDTCFLSHLYLCGTVIGDC